MRDALINLLASRCCTVGNTHSQDALGGGGVAGLLVLLPVVLVDEVRVPVLVDEAKKQASRRFKTPLSRNNRMQAAQNTNGLVYDLLLDIQ